MSVTAEPTRGVRARQRRLVLSFGTNPKVSIPAASSNPGSRDVRATLVRPREVSGHLVGPAAFKAVGTGDPRPAGSIPVHLRQDAARAPSSPMRIRHSSTLTMRSIRWSTTLLSVSTNAFSQRCERRRGTGGPASPVPFRATGHLGGGFWHGRSEGDPADLERPHQQWWGRSASAAPRRRPPGGGNNSSTLTMRSIRPSGMLSGVGLARLPRG
jgi:hypothetical protein